MKIFKNWWLLHTQKIIAVINLKFEQCGWCPKDKEGMANSVEQSELKYWAAIIPELCL